VYDGSISTAAAIYQFSVAEIPAGSVVRAIIASEVCLIDGWISIGENQYANTGVKGKEACGLEMKFQRYGSNGPWASVIGSTIDNFTIGQNGGNNNQFYLRYQGVNGGLQAFSWSDTSVPHTIHLKHSLNDGNGHVNAAEVDGARVTLKFLNDKNKVIDGPVGTLGTDEQDILIGSSNDGNGSSGRYCYCCWHYVKIFDAMGSDMLHLVPAIRGNSASPEGLFYDKVSGRVFTNLGSNVPFGVDQNAKVTETIPNSFTIASSAAFSMLTRAYWIGLGNLQNVNDPANWACTNAVGAEVKGEIPDTSTIVIVRGATNFNIPTGQKLAYREFHIENCTLTADCDWSGLASSDTVIPLYTLQYVDIPKGVYFDTGFKPNNNTRVVLDIMSHGGWESWFGITDDTSKEWWKNRVFGVSNDNTEIFVGFGNEGGGIQPGVTVGRHTIDYDKGELKVDGEVHGTRSGQTFQLERTMYLFATHRPNDVELKNNSPAPRFYSCKIYDNGTLVRDYIPVQNGDKVGLYDKVNNSFAWNIGSAAFSVRADVPIEDTFLLSETKPVPIDGTVDLAGYSLKLEHTTGIGTITDTVRDGKLYINVPSGATLENSTVTFTGLMKLVKEGKGTFIGAKADQTYTGGTVVNAGIAQSGAYSGAWGPHKSTITVADGASFDYNGKVNSATQTAYSFGAAGTGVDGAGAVYSSVSSPNDDYFYDRNHIADMELAGDTLMTVPSSSKRTIFGFRYKGNTDMHYLTMNGHTLTVVIGDRFAISPLTTIGSGTIVCLPSKSVGGSIGYNRQISFYGASSDLSNVTLDIHDGTSINVEIQSKVATFIDRRKSLLSGVPHNDELLIVRERFQPSVTFPLKTIQLGDATFLTPTLDLGSVTGCYITDSESDFALTYAAGATVTVNLTGARTDVKTIAKMKDENNKPCGYVLSWSKKPENVEFMLDENSLKMGYKLEVNDKGLLLFRDPGLMIKVR
jgi:hypothetical protein